MTLTQLHVLQCANEPDDCVPAVTEDEVREAITALLNEGLIFTSHRDDDGATYRTTRYGRDFLAASAGTKA